MTPHDSMNTVFAAFAEAARALEEKPLLEETVIAARLERDAARFALDTLRELHNANMIEKLTLQDRIASLEDSLELATFREKEAGDKLALVAAVLKDSMKATADVVELVEPTPVSQSEPDPTEHNPSTGFTAMAENYTSAPTQPATHTEDPCDPFALPTGNQPPGIGADTKGAATPDSTPSPFVPSMEEPYTTAALNSTESPASPSDGAYLTYKERPYTEKPEDMTWAEWVCRGGDMGSQGWCPTSKEAVFGQA